MKKVLVAAALAFTATTASAAIAGGSHDMNVFLGTGTTYSACAFCHMPHNATTVNGAPLFARNTSYAVSFATYSSNSAGAQPKVGATALGLGSRLCLSCHDGTFALASVLNANANGMQNVAGGRTNTLTGPRVIGTDLTNDHPVSMGYYTTAALFGLRDPVGGSAYLGAFGITAVGQTVECTTCHNAHGAKIPAGAYPNRNFMANYTGDFCVACHATK